MRIRNHRRDYPGEAWAREFVFLSVVALRHGLISSRVFADRMLFLYSDGESFVDPPLLEWSLDHIPCDEAPLDNDCLADREELDATMEGPAFPAFDSAISFRLAAPSPFHEWIFTPGDTDPIPSIPHGHRGSKFSPFKLDPYRGHVYRDRTFTGQRLTLRECKTFWRNGGFRRMAREAIQNALDDPRVNALGHFKARKITDPFKLPR